ncbi:DNA-binding response regulator, LuxR family [[Actinomadura] parvosata subsp. kistnae]|uniref:DNA-binding response regulator n=1 Tax=[Actinomadura] parvosata subsp. kistnae TaxID=1909395 RepID=A0A1V0A1U2_9ACTN|nr:response regulator transcription factor [Nonomuraea sp. ATCC 55076]AQZ64153.1 DNA-binding response regulator [Nonomuraea sp. ATCC 55076]SPL87362.1 DNA-binding response regulator, LuxR family [Actinomadura parvosata subsp. kistnae]
MITVLLADDQPLVRAGLRALLDTEDDLTVIGEAADGAQAVRLARELRPDVVLMDIRMPELDGLQATRGLAGTGVRVVVVTTFDLDEYVYEALRSGASGFLVKDAEPAEIRHAVRVAARGDALLSPQVTRRLIEEFTARPAVLDEGRLSGLTGREREVLARVAKGLTNARIAEELFMSPLTVKTHVNRMMAKLSAHDRAQLVVIAYESGLVRPGEHGEG